MISRNRVDIIGTLGADPEVSQLPSGTLVARMRVATKEVGSVSGQKTEHAEWHAIEAWGKTAQNAGEHLRVGDQVAIEGRLRTEKYTDAQGIERYSTKIVAERLVFGSKGPTSRAERSARQAVPVAPQQPYAAPQQQNWGQQPQGQPMYPQGYGQQPQGQPVMPQPARPQGLAPRKAQARAPQSQGYQPMADQPPIMDSPYPGGFLPEEQVPF